MSKLLRKIFLPLMCVVMVLGLCGAVACSKKPKEKFTITVEATQNGTITSDLDEAAEGETVTLTVTPDEGYYLSDLTVNGEAATATNGTATFNMPAENVTVKGSFLKEGENAINVGDVANAKITANKKTAEEGDTVTLTVTVDYGYQLTELKMNGADLTVTNGKATFNMPNAVANVTAATAKLSNIKTEATPAEQLTLVSKIGTDTATSYWSAQYGDEALEITVYVSDAKVSANRDGVEIYFGKKGYAYAKPSDVNFGVKVTADGAVTQYVYNDGYATDATGKVTVESATPWSKDGSEISGYVVKVSVPYANLGYTDKTDADGKITVLPVLANFTSALGTTAVYNGYEKTNTGAYLEIKDGKWEENYYAKGAGALGSTGKITATNGWDLSKDYAEEDVENYENREAKLDASTGNDNDIVFFRSEGKDSYAEATFKADGAIKNGERLAKLGLMLYDGADNKGYFFYIEADSKGDDYTTITGNGLGYTEANGGYKWGHDHVASGVYNKDNPFTLKMAYDSSAKAIYMWYNNGGEDVLMTKVRYEASGDVAIGIKAFKIDITVSKYFATNDKTNEKFAAHIVEKSPDAENNLGDSSTMFAGGHWDLSKDYATDAANYASREVKLTGHDGADNNLFFKASEGKSAYVRATFKVDEIYNRERFGKFGLMFFNGDKQTGAFFYVDAYVGGNRDEDYDGVIKGRGLGYNYAPNGWGSWNGLNAVGDVFNLSNKTITLAMTYDSSTGVLSMYYVNDKGQDVLAKQVVCVANSSAYVIGIKSFAYGLTVTDYSVTTEKNADFNNHNPAIEQQTIDVLFAGDSYMDFWKLYGVWDTLTYDLTSQGVKLEDVGVGGTQVPYWNNDGQILALQKQYNVSKIAFHIGVNDIDGGVSVNDAYDRLVSLYTNYHTAFPNAELYWVSLIPNNFYIKNGGTFNEEYLQLNAKVKALADERAYLTYIDVTTAFTDEEGNARTNLFVNDGLHLNVVYGYPLWTSIIKEALGYQPAATDDELGDITTEHIQRKATSGWSYNKNGNIAEIGTDVVFGTNINVEEAVYYKDLYGADILFEADIRSSDFYRDDGAKPGVMLVNDQFTLFGYLATYNDTAQNNGRTQQWYGLLYRNNVYNNAGKPVGVDNWNWDTVSQYDVNFGQTIGQINICDEYHKLGIAKVGTTIYLLVDGNVVRTCTVPGVTADMKFSAGVMTFNRYMEVKSVKAISGADNIEYEFAETRNITVAAPDGVTVSVEGNKTTAKKTDTISFTVDVGEDNILDKVSVYYDNQDHYLTANNGKYSFTMPDENVTIKVTLVGKVGVTLDSTATQNITVDKVSVNSGETVTFTAKANVYIKKLYKTGANGTPVEIQGDGNTYSLELTEDVTISGEFYEMIDGIIYDGELTANEGWTNDIKAKVLSEYFQGTKIDLIGRTTQAGIVLGFTVKHQQPVDTKLQGGEGWHVTLNFELRFNNNTDLPVRANFIDYTENCKVAYSTGANPNAKDDGYNYISTMEMVVPHSVYNTNSTSNITIALGGVFGDRFTWLFDIYELGNNFFWRVTPHGMEGICSPAVLDGVFNDDVWTAEAKANAYRGVINGAQIEYIAVKTTNGVMIGATVNHTRALLDVIQANGADWWNYMGPEFRLFNQTKQIAASANGQTRCASASRKSVDNGDGTYTTTFELFVPFHKFSGVDTSGDIPIAFAGVFEVGYAAVLGSAWNDDAVFYSPLLVTSKGLISAPKNVAGVNLDGRFTDSVWTETILGAEHTVIFNVNSSKIEVNGVKLTDGVLLGVRINTNKSSINCLGTERGAWEHYQNIRFNLFAVTHELPILAPCIMGIGGNEVTGIQQFGFFEADNGKDAEYRYTSTYEVYIPYASYSGQDTSGNIALTLIVNTDVNELVACGQTEGAINWFQISCYFSNDGMVAA